MTILPSFDPFVIEKMPFYGEELTFCAYNVPKYLSMPNARQRSSFASVLAKIAPTLSDDARWTISRSVSDPATVGPMLAKGIGVSERCAGDSALTLMSTRVDLASVLVLDQPRGAETPGGVSGPKIRGALDEDGVPRPQLVFEFPSWDEVRRHVEHTIDTTLKQGQHLAPSILSSGVSKPILLTVATIRVAAEPGGEPEEITALIALDGHTRLICAHQAALSGGTKPGSRISLKELPAAIASRMLHRTERVANLSRAHERGRAEKHAEAVDRFIRAAAVGDTTNPDLARFGQTASIPAEVVIGFRRFDTPLAMREFEFVDAVRSDVGQQHSLSRAWPDGSITANVGQQAIARAVAAGKLDAEIGSVAEGSVDFTPPVTLIPVPADSTDGGPGGPAVGDEPAALDSTLDPGLARAVFLLHALTQPGASDEIKRHIRNLGGHKKIDRNTYAKHIASVLWREWAPFKEASHDNEAAAWRVGGALVTESEPGEDGKPEKTADVVFGKPWEALFPPRWVDLVPVALDASDPRSGDAKVTLQVAGGIALIADGLLLAGSGSTKFGANGQEYVRRHPSTILALLGKNELGLYTLAHAADSFQSHRQASNSFSKTQDIPAGVYAVAFPKSAAEPSVAETSVNGVYQNFDQIRDVAGLRAKTKSPEKRKPVPKCQSEQLADLAGDLRGAVADAVTAQRAMTELIRKSPRLAGEAFADNDDWAALQSDLMDVLMVVRGWQPMDPRNNAVIDDDDDDDIIKDVDDFDDEVLEDELDDLGELGA